MVALLFVATALAGCLGDGKRASVGDRVPLGVHPWPSGDEWPPGLEGPFDILPVLHAPVLSFDGVALDGWIVRPAVPEGVRVPVVLWSAPYFGQCGYYPPPTTPEAAASYPYCSYATGDDEELWDQSSVSEAVPVRFLVERGHAVAIYNVRGTGNSGGCFEWFGPNEQRDQAELVQWLGEQPWSNGRVGMMGLSYHGTTPWEAAIQDPGHLKTIVVAGMISDAYLFSHTPQGATFTTIGLFEAQFALRVSLSPPLKGGPGHSTFDHAGVAADRLCPEVAAYLAEDAAGTVADDRNAAFWEGRRLIDRFPDITASVFLTHGFQDLWYSGHQMQERDVWNLLPGPKRMLEGQWGHSFPNINTVNADRSMEDWNERLLAWLDFWLKGIGEAPPREGVVDYQENTGAWLESSAWPPAEAREEVLHLASGALSPSAGVGSSRFRSVPVENFPAEAMCANKLDAFTGARGLLFRTEPLASPLLLAGNPFAYLRVTSDRPGGLLAVHLYDVDGDVACPEAQNARRLAVGVADLRFHGGSYGGKDFPINAPTDVRVDITNLAERIEQGHRLAALVSYGDAIDRAGQPWSPTIGLDASASHLVLPLVEGSLGGAPPNANYPPRPFLPVAP